MKKVISVVVLVVFSLFLVGCIVNQVMYNFKGWGQPIKSYWVLMDEASTLKAKSDYLDTCLDNASKLKVAEYGAIIFKKPSNNTVQNFKVLKTLQERLHRLKSIDETSFAYTTAINQITAQESEASISWGAIYCAWLIETNIFMLDWVSMIWWTIMCIVLSVSIWFVNDSFQEQY